MKNEIDLEKFERFKESVERNDKIGDKTNLKKPYSHAVLYVNTQSNHKSEDVFSFKNKQDFLIYIDKLYEDFEYSEQIQQTRSSFADIILKEIGKQESESFKVTVVPQTPQS